MKRMYLLQDFCQEIACDVGGLLFLATESVVSIATEHGGWGKEHHGLYFLDVLVGFLSQLSAGHGCNHATL